MKTLNELISGYTYQLQQGEIQLAYKGIFWVHFSLTTKPLKDKGLKIAIVYLHEKGNFEVWLSARNREISKLYESVFWGKNFDGITVFHDDNNQDAIIECILTSSPNFEEQVILTDIIEQGTEAFIDFVKLN